MSKESVKLLVYGSLRSEGYNNRSQFKSLGLTKIKGYKLYSLGPYPGINEGEEDDELVCEILEVSPKDAQWIDRMEIGAGYRLEKKTVDGHECTLYVHNRDLSERPHVEHGDWIKYRQEQRTTA